MQRHIWLLFTLLNAGLFLVFDQFINRVASESPSIEDRIVITAPIQLLLSGGDRFLAADLEAIRSAASGAVSGEDDALYRIRAHRVVSQLNPCHEDNYYVGNALLTWGGAVKEGNDILLRATECRYWDEYPPFFYGFNQHFFNHDNIEAQRAFEIAAQRSANNYAAIKKIAIMLAAGDIDDDQLALDYLKQQRDKASDPKLKQMLDKRVGRLEGLIVLRNAQIRFEQHFHRSLKTPDELLASRELDRFPVDPLGLGYEFNNGIFELRRFRIAGMEEMK